MNEGTFVTPHRGEMTAMEKGTKLRRKFKLLPGRIGLEPESLTEARKIVGAECLNCLAVGEMVHFKGLFGNPLEFMIQRVR